MKTTTTTTTTTTTSNLVFISRKEKGVDPPG